MGGFLDGGKITNFSKFCFGPKIAPKGSLGLKIGESGPKNARESKNSARNVNKHRKKCRIQNFGKTLKFLEKMKTHDKPEKNRKTCLGEMQMGGFVNGGLEFTKFQNFVLAQNSPPRVRWG